jgi:hypothetical protein
MVDSFGEALRPCREAMEALAGAGQRLRESRSLLPDTESAGMDELASEHRYAGIWGDQPIWTAYTTAGVSLFAAEDGMRGVSRLFERDFEPVTVCAHLILGRGVLEACARARWLLESSAGIDARVRVVRVLAHRASDLEEQRRVEKLIDPLEVGESAAKLDDLLSNAERAGMTRQTKKGDVVVDPAMPGYRRLVVDLFAKSPGGTAALPSVLYSYFSSVAHAHTYGFMQNADRDQVEHDLVGGGLKVPIVVDSSAVNSCIAYLCLGYVEAIDEQCRLMNWQDEDWSRARLDNLRTIRTALPDQPDADG